MKFCLFIVIFFFCLAGCTSSDDAVLKRDSAIKYEAVRLTASDKQILQKSLEKLEKRYDPEEAMLTKKLNGFNYHTDADSGVFHAVRPSLAYAIVLMDAGGRELQQRAFKIIEKVISLQDTVSASKTCGIWPYYLEEPLATKKTPPDPNWADFCGVNLLDILMTHHVVIPPGLQNKIRTSLIFAARAIQKRDMGPHYTNISLMGTYVTFMSSHLFDIPDMKAYAGKRMEHFYDYTLRLGGFSEYNSPNYTLVALDVLQRMKMHIADQRMSDMIDALYNMGWDMIARHFHRPSGQWAGPHSRSYSTLIEPAFYVLLNQASAGKINIPVASENDAGATEKIPNLKIKHTIPENLLHYFLQPEYPRTETDIFTAEEPNIVGTTYLTDQYAFSSASRSLLWAQRRPFLVYWGSARQPRYIRARFLHDDYDFSSAIFYSKQDRNKLLAAINFVTDGGDRHISGYFKIKDAKFKAKDLRLRFEIGPSADIKDRVVPKTANSPFRLELNNLAFNIHLYYSAFGNFKGYWQAGGDKNTSWIDYVIYSGEETEIDLNKIKEAVLGFTFCVGEDTEKFPKADPRVIINDSTMRAEWEGLELNTWIKPALKQKNL